MVNRLCSACDQLRACNLWTVGADAGFVSQLTGAPRRTFQLSTDGPKRATTAMAICACGCEAVRRVIGGPRTCIRRPTTCTDKYNFVSLEPPASVATGNCSRPAGRRAEGHGPDRRTRAPVSTVGWEEKGSNSGKTEE